MAESSNGRGSGCGWLCLVPTLVRLAGGFVGARLFFLSVAVVGMPAQPVVQFLLVAVQAGVGPGQGVHLRVLVTLLAVEVGHVPAVLLVVVVVGVGAVVGGRDALGVRRRRAVVKVHSTVSNFCARAKARLLGRASARGAHTNHPDEEDEQHHKDDRTSDTSGDVGKFGLFSTILSGEGAGALAVGRSENVLQADTLIFAFSLAHVETVVNVSGSVVAQLTPAAIRVV